MTGPLNDAAFSSYTPTISPPDVQGTDIVFQKATGFPAGSTMTATFEYRTSGGSYVSLTPASSGSTWRVSVGSLAAGTNYQYRISYRQDGRTVSQQEGTFLLTFHPATTSTAVTVTQGSQQVVAPVATVGGSSGVGSINYTGASSSVWTSTPQGSFWAGPNRVFVTTAALPAGSYEMRVEYLSASSQPRTAIGSYPPPAIHPNEFHWDGSGGLSSVSSVQIFRINADGTRALIRDRSVSGAGSPQSLSWAAPSAVTARFWYYDNGWIEKTPTASGGNLSVDLAGLTNKDYNYQVAYYRPGETSPMVEATGTFRSDGVSITMVGGQTNINRNPTWFGTSALNSRVQWAHAVPPDFTAVFEYLSGGTWVSRPVTHTGGSNYYADMSGVPQGNYDFRVEYRRAGDPFPGAWSRGTVQVQVTTVNNFTTLAATKGADTLFPTARITNPVMSDDVVSWSYAKQNTSDSVVFSYTVNGTTYSETLSGTGPNFSATMSQLPAGSSVAVTWSIEYKRSGEGSPYAAAYGSTSLSVEISQQQPIFGVLSQQHAYPTVIPLTAPTHVGGGQMRWSETPEAGAIVEFKYGSTNAAISADRMQADLSGLADGTYTYTLTFRRPGQPTPYAQVTGTFTLSRTATLGAMNITVNNATSAATVRPTTTQVTDRWGNAISITDAAGNTTLYRYSVLGQLVETQMPTLKIIDTRAASNLVNIAVSTVTPTERRYYDILGRVVGARDANGNLMAVALNSAGQVVDEYQPDGHRSFQYDTFGNQTLIIDELNWRTINKYDAMDRLTATKNQVTGTNGVGTYISREFTYDQAGRRITETSGEKKADNTPEITSYFYDLEDRVVRRKTPMGAQTWYEYDVNGNKKREIDAMFRELTWTYDFAGRTLTHRDMSNATTTYTYTGIGLISTLRNTTLGQSIDYTYDDAGNLRTIDDDGVNRLTTYGYDFAGRRAVEITVVNNLTHQKVRIKYDEHNRISELTDLRYKLTYQYDAQGNRTHTEAEYLDQTFAKVTQNLWYQYDAENRVTFSQGALLDNGNGTYRLMINANQGVRIAYNAAGQRTSATRFGTDRLLRETAPGGSSTIRQSTGEFTERYVYDGAGRLTDISRSVYEQATTPEGYPQGSPVYIGEFNVIHRVYDGASRVIREDQQQVDPSTTVSTYDDDGRLSDQTSRVLNSISGAFRQQITYQYDAANVLVQYQVQANEVDGSLKYNAYYINSYEARDTLLLTTQTVSTQGPGVDQTSGGIRREYNANREMIAEIDMVKPDQSRFFANDASGNALTVVRGNIGSAYLQTAFSQALTSPTAQYKSHHLFFANGEAVGNAGQLAKPTPSTTFSANFDVNFTPALDLAPSSTPPVVVTGEGETLRQIASRVWGDGTLWYLIAEENGLTAPDEAMVAGLALRIPANVVSVANDAATFKPFDVRSAIDELNPAQRGYPKGPGATCGVMGQVILTVIAIVVTIIIAKYLPQAAEPAAKAMFAAIAAMGGSVASQGVAVLTGYQDRIDWKQVALAGVSAGVGQGLSSVNIPGIPEDLSRLAKAAIHNVAVQGASVALGLQKSFSWREVAVSALANTVASAVGEGVTPTSQNSSEFVSDLKVSVARGIASSGVRAAFGEKVDFAHVVADAFGNFLGNSIVASLNGAPAPKGHPAPVANDPVDELAEVVVTVQRIERPLDNNPSEAARLPAGTSLTPDQLRRTTASAAAQGSSAVTSEAPQLRLNEQTNQWTATMADGTVWGWDGSQWGAPLEIVTVAADRMSDIDKRFYDDGLSRGWSGDTIARFLKRKNEIVKARYTTPATAQEIAALKANGKPLVYGELWQMREQTMPIGGLLTMSDAGTGAQDPMHQRLYDWYGEKASNVVDAVHSPGQGLIGLAKAVPNAITGTIDVLGQALAAQGALESGRDLGFNQDQTLALMHQMQGEVHDVVSHVTFDYANTAQAGGAFGFDIGTAAVGGVSLGNSAFRGVRSLTGGRILTRTNPEDWIRAEAAYDAIRADATDIAAIARNTGMPETRLSRIKAHIFENEHQLSSRVGRFDADPDIVNAWSRLKAGDFQKSDIDLLRHERFEMKFEGIFRTNYVDAHNAALRRGYIWLPE